MNRDGTERETRADWHNSSPVRAPIAWYGGKACYADWIIDHFPPHHIYVEPFGGMASVLLAKKPSGVEVYNDMDDRVVNFFRVLRDRSAFKELQRLSSLTPCSRQEFGELCEAIEPDDSVLAAWRFFTICRQARGGLGMSRATPSAWAVSKRTRRGMPEQVSKYLSAIDGMADVAERLREVVIEKMPATELIEKYDADDTFFYCDPPYPAETRHGGRADVYGVEMIDKEHAELLCLLNACRGKVAISSYESSLYNDLLAGWRRVEKATMSQVANSGEARTEVMWLNWWDTDLPPAENGPSLFDPK